MTSPATAKLHTHDYTAKELAELANVTTARIRQLLAEQVLRGQKRGGAWFITPASAKAWLESRK